MILFNILFAVLNLGVAGLNFAANGFGVMVLVNLAIGVLCSMGAYQSWTFRRLEKARAAQMQAEIDAWAAAINAEIRK